MYWYALVGVLAIAVLIIENSDIIFSRGDNQRFPEIKIYRRFLSFLRTMERFTVSRSVAELGYISCILIMLEDADISVMQATLFHQMPVVSILESSWYWTALRRGMSWDLEYFSLMLLLRVIYMPGIYMNASDSSSLERFRADSE